MKTTRVFLDTSALFAAIWSASGGARKILKLGEAKAITPIVSSRVLVELEGAIRRKADGLMPRLAVLLETSGLEEVSEGSHSGLNLTGIINHPADEKSIETAFSAEADYIVTLDREHFLNNQFLIDSLPFPIGTPGDFLNWYGSSLVRN